jgi:twitching motility protein PilT
MRTNEAMTMLRELVAEAKDAGASDLLLIPRERPAMRLPAGIERLQREALTPELLRAMAVELLGAATVDRIGRELGAVSRLGEGEDLDDVIVNVGCSRGMTSLTIQLNRPVMVSAERCRIPKAMLDAMLAQKGLVIFSGVDGSGKSTSAYSALGYLSANRACHICTVEDPIYVHVPAAKALVQQRQVGVDVPNVLEGIQAAMKQDFDVLFLGGITGLEELQASIAVAEKGHVVLTQMHQPTPEEAIRRLMDVFPEDIRAAALRALARALGAVSAQRLLPGIAGGRVAAYAVLVPDEEMRSAIAAGHDFTARRTPLPAGCQTMAESIRQLAAEGLISADTARRALEEEEGPRAR